MVARSDFTILGGEFTEHSGELKQNFPEPLLPVFGQTSQQVIRTIPPMRERQDHLQGRLDGKSKRLSFFKKKNYFGGKNTYEYKGGKLAKGNELWVVYIRSII